MTPIADMIEEMMAGGVPLNIILLAVRTAERMRENEIVRRQSADFLVDEQAERRRAADRKRAEVRRQSADSPQTQENASSLKRDNLTKKESKKEEAIRKSGRRLSADWKPSEDHFAEAQSLGRSREEVDAKADAMRLWAQANGHRAVARKLDWDATFLGWMRRDWPKPQNGLVVITGPPKPPHPDMPSDAELRAFYAKKRAGLERNPAPGSSGVLPEGAGNEGDVVQRQAGNGRV